MYKVKETFEYLVNDPNNFCSVHDALEMDTSMPCPCWEGSKVPVNEKGEEESIPWGNSEVSITDIGNIVKIDKDTLLKLIKNSEKLSTLEEWGVDNWINYGWEEIEDYMPDDIADKYLEFCESHNSDEVYDYLKRLYSYIQVINLEYTILDIDSEKGYVEYKAIIKVNNKYYSFDYYQSPYWNFKDQADEDLTEVFPKEITTVIYV